jgi:uncharacterized protein (TIGR02594 family)
MSVVKTVLDTDPPYLKAAFADLGVREVAGRGKKNANPSILAAFAAAGHGGVVDDETAWCSAKMCQWQASDGLPLPAIVEERLMGLSWEKMGRAITLEEAERGDICTFYYAGKDTWQRHVCYFLGVDGKKIWVIGGNQTNAVTVTSFPVANLSKIRRPVRPTPKDLLDAGSTEIAAINLARKVAVGGGVGTGTAAGVQAATETPEVPAEVVTPPTDGLNLPDIATDVSAGQTIMDGVTAIGNGILHNPWVIVTVVAIGIVFLATHWWQKSRLERHKSGQPISTQVEAGAVLAG